MKQRSLRQVIKAHCDIKNIRFIQVGANDGIRGDPIRKMIVKYNWKGILIEPQEDVFLELKNNYKDLKELAFENVAIHRCQKYVSLFRYLRDSRISSLYPDNRCLGKKNPEYIIEETVKAMTLNEVMSKHKWRMLDLLQIDAEGYDFAVIKTLDLNKYKPKIINYEEVSLRGQKRSKRCKKYLKKFGYRKFVQTHKNNVAAIYTG